MSPLPRRPYLDPHATVLELDGYFNRLVQYVCLTPAHAADPTSRSARIAAKKVGRRDAELSSIDVDTMTPVARELLLAHLVRTQRLWQAIEKFPNLAGLTGGVDITTKEH